MQSQKHTNLDTEYYIVPSANTRELNLNLKCQTTRALSLEQEPTARRNITD